jgi:hypothetical protein
LLPALYGPRLAIRLRMAKCLIGWRTFLAVLNAMPPAEAAMWLDRFSFDETGAVLIESGQSPEDETALASAFMPSNTIH